MKTLINRSLFVWMSVFLLFLFSCGDDNKEGLTEVIGNENKDAVNGKTDNNENVNGNTEINGHEAVDLGLSVKWATCNVGASSPEEYGNRYAWGRLSENPTSRQGGSGGHEDSPLL